ncbi:hypothetical protein RUM43_005960 [Polyplax serrata]|uniref:Uncharacterized protein n=1 Tax=Polyplax serrata TaxID=468196 RepID=A0AAN8RV21_POLSC
MKNFSVLLCTAVCFLVSKATPPDTSDHIRFITIEGSSLSIRLVYHQFIKCGNGNSLKLIKEYVEESKRGLSAYASFPDECCYILSNLLDGVKKIIPKERWRETNIALMVSPGVEHFAGKQTTKLLSVAGEYLKCSGFRMIKNGVRVLGNLEAQLLSWFSLNLISGRLSKSSKTGVVIECRGVSAMTAFVPKEESQINKDINNLFLYEQKYRVYSKSFPGLGLYEMRHRIFQMGNCSIPNVFVSECIHPSVKAEWIHRGVEYRVKGIQKHSNASTSGTCTRAVGIDFNKCKSMMQILVGNHEKPLATFESRKVYALSEFFTRFLAAGLVGSKVAVIFPGQWNFCDTFKANVCDKLGLFFGLRQQVYSTVIECGDYKCRLACYSFIPTRNGKNLRYHEIVLKGINSTVDEFVHESKKFKDAIDELLGVARRTIPKAVWQESPLILVGNPSFLDVVSKDELACLKHLMSSHLRNTGFLVQKQPMVVCTNRNEGLLNWFTVNMMLGRLNGKQSKTAAVLSLGCTSNLVTFVATEEERKIENYQKFITTETFGRNNEFQIYSRGLPELGIEEVRKKIIEKGTYECGMYYSVCISPSLQGYWKYKNTTYRVAGSAKSTPIILKSNGLNYTVRVVDVEKCEALVRQVLLPLPVVPSLAGRDIYGLKSYFRTFVTAGLVDGVRGGSFSIEELYKSVQYNCKQANSSLAFLCMDLMYIIVVLQDLYGLGAKDTIYLTENIKKHGVRTALAFAYLNLVTRVRRD